jgi:tight adherence protein B
MVSVDGIVGPAGAIALAAVAVSLITWPWRPGLPTRAPVSGTPPLTAPSKSTARRTVTGDRRRGRGSPRAGTSGRRWRSRARVALVLAAAVAAAVQTARWQLVVAAVIVGATAWRLVRRARSAARTARTAGALLLALRAMVRELDAGADQRHALARITDAAPPDVRLLIEEATRGDGESAFADAAPPTALDETLRGDASRIRAAWRLSAARGIPLGVVLHACIVDVEDRATTARLRAQHVAGPAVSGYVLAALPAAGLAMGSGMGAQPVSVLLGGPLGGTLLCIGVALCCMGLLWTDRIVRGRRHG